MDRDCENCIHKVNGACNVWECKFEPKEDEPFEPREDAISRQAVIQHICENKSCYEENCKGVLFNRCMDITWVNELPPVNPQKPCKDCQYKEWLEGEDLPSVNPKQSWIPVSERLPELNRPLLVTAYHRVYYGHLISESGNYGYPVFRIHGLGDKNRDWVQETMSHGPYSLGRIDAWMYLDIPEPYKPQEGGDQE